MTQVRRTTPTNYVTTTTVNNIPTTTCCTTSTVLNVSTSNTINYTACAPTGTTGEIIPTSTPSSINSSVATPNVTNNVPTGTAGCYNTTATNVSTASVTANAPTGTPTEIIPTTTPSLNSSITTPGSNCSSSGITTTSAAGWDPFGEMGMTASEEVMFNDIKDLFIQHYTSTQHYKDSMTSVNNLIAWAEGVGSNIMADVENYFANLFTLNANGTTNTVGAVPTNGRDPSPTADPSYYGDFNLQGVGFNYQYQYGNSTYKAHADTKYAGVGYRYSSNGTTCAANASYYYSGTASASASYSGSNGTVSAHSTYSFDESRLKELYLKAALNFYELNINACMDLLSGTVGFDAQKYCKGSNGIWFKVSANVNTTNGTTTASLGVGWKF